MTVSAWLAAAALCWHGSLAGGLPRETSLSSVAAYAEGRLPVRVLLVESAQTIYVRPEMSAELLDAVTRERLAALGPGALAVVRPAQASASAAAKGGVPQPLVCVEIGRARVRASGVVFRRREGGALIMSIAATGRQRERYMGELEFCSIPTGLRAVERTDLEDYVAGVVAAELPASFPLEAMKAQAIAARSYALFHLGDHARQGADLCGEVHCQLYRGVPDRASRAAAAARDTAGQVLAWGGLVVDAMYHSACGGATASGWQVRPDKLLPYLRGRSDLDVSQAQPSCARSHPVAWKRRIPWQRANALIATYLGPLTGQPGLRPGRLKSLRVGPRTSGGRAEWVEVVTERGSYRVRGDASRWLFGTGQPGPGGLPSASYVAEIERDRRGRPRALVFRGQGSGHGIGLCQWGARGRALAGQTAFEILRAYYPGAEIVDMRADGRDRAVPSEATP